MRDVVATAPAGVDVELRPSALLYLSVGLVAGAVIALQICIMRIFSVGSWAHFGSLVVSLAMLGFGLTSAIMCVAKNWFARHWQAVAGVSLILFGPLMVTCNLAAQTVPFNVITLLSDETQKWNLFKIFLLYMVPFLAGAFFLGAVFLKAQKTFNRVYFADLTGAGLCGLLILVAMYLLKPDDLIVAPLFLWFVGSLLWFLAVGSRLPIGVLAIAAAASLAGHLIAPPALGIPKLAVSAYKGSSYARNFPDKQLIYEHTSPFGFVEVFASSYQHFAPGLSDSASANSIQMPKDAFLGLYIDSDGPNAIIRKLPPEKTEFYRYLSMYYPYLIKKDPETFVIQFGGGLSTAVALRNSKTVTVAEGNPAVLEAFRNSKSIKDFTGDILNDPKIRVIDYDGRLYLAHAENRYDVIDLSLADSAGLSNASGIAVVEKFAYTRQAMLSYMRALHDGGIVSVTLWNREEPPKSLLKLYATMAGAARELDPKTMAQSFFVASNYLSTATVLYKRGGFTADEIAKLRDHTKAMSFDEIYYPGMQYDEARTKAVLDAYRSQIFEADPAAASPAGAPASPTAPAGAAAGPNGAPSATGPAATGPAATGPAAAAAEPALDEPKDAPPPDAPGGGPLPSVTLGQMAWHYLLNDTWDKVQQSYLFDIRPLTNNRPYFAAYIKPLDLFKITDRLELFQDELGYLLLWATLGIACVCGLVLVLFPVIFGWRTIFSRYPGKFRTIVYFACLGAGYIMVEVGLIAYFVQALSNATVSASVLITGMLVFSGLGAFASEKILGRAKTIMPIIFLAIGVLLIAYGLYLDRLLDQIGTLPYGLRLACCFGLIFPPAFLMGFPMPTAMTALGRLGKEHMFLWAWGINGCFSVIGAAAVPIIATSFGLASVLMVAGVAYLIAIGAFFAVLLPLAPQRPETA